MSSSLKNTTSKRIIFFLLVLVSIYVLFPILVAFMNSFKGRLLPNLLNFLQQTLKTPPLWDFQTM